MAPKRRATSPVRPSPSKRRQVNLSGAAVDGKPSSSKSDYAAMEERHGIVQREFYPPVMSSQRCEQYNSGELPRPMAVLNELILRTKTQREAIPAAESVVHWFKRDLRLFDNRALRMASDKAQSKGVPLICIFVISPQDYQAHLTSSARVDFELRTLEVLKADLEDLNIPLAVTTIEKRKDVPSFIIERCIEWGAKHVFCNIEYEVDELRRETNLTKMCLKQGIDFHAVHDDVIVPPGEVKTGAGKQFSVYSPWYRAWVKHLHSHPRLLNASEPPSPNLASAKKRYQDLFASVIPPAPSNKSLEPDERVRFAKLWPAGEHEAKDRLQHFITSQKIVKYKDTRNLPSANNTAMLSVHFAAGTLAARSAVRAAQEANSAKALDAGAAGITTWIAEVAWRDFYKHVLAHWPYVCMHKPFKHEYTEIEWDDNESLWLAWSEGRTGFPIVDAGMRQATHMGWMHNRVRMIVASFLAKDLLLDWRRGERWFMEHLIDGDFASNNGGWGFSASTGVDPQPYFRIFNPLLQSEKFDAEGEYIRKWVPELADVPGKAIHDPYGRGAGKLAEKNGYPKPVVDHSERRKLALERYKTGLGRSTANVGGGVHN